jgi:hypothetical protein
VRSHTFDVILRNVSRYPIDIVWENAQDLEHVPYLHRATNSAFWMLYADPDPSGRHPYQTMVFMVRRKLLGFIPVTSFGIRRIAGEREIWQMERNPLLRVETRLRSTLERNRDNPHRTDLVDYVRVTVPAALRPFEARLAAALRRHTRIQCEQDESFRARRVELRERGIVLPLTLFNQPAWDEVFAGLRN